MCGFCGEVRFDGEPASVAAIGRMTDVLAPRGPDGFGLYAQGTHAFGHRRLAVFDLSERGAQPMVDPELGLGVVCNGTIYNHRELRAELEGRGYRFFSSGDTEVLLKGYHAWGEGVIERLDGMFAFALWERDSGRVLLARDRLGIKPLYYTVNARRLRFASTLPALIAAGDIDTRLDPDGLHDYLVLQGAILAPRTVVRGASKLPAGHLIRLEPDGSVAVRRYWRLRLARRAGDAARAPEEWRDRIASTLRATIRRHVLGDVQWGLFLSGGLDSSLIVALLAEAGVSPIRTFSLSFPRVGAERGSEHPFSDRVAARYATEHRRLRVTEGELLAAIEGCVGAMSEPQVSADALGFYLLAVAAAKSVRVVLTGQGADEVFAGYHWYEEMLRAADGPGYYASLARAMTPRDYRDAVRRRHRVDDVSGAGGASDAGGASGASGARGARLTAEFAGLRGLRAVERALTLDTSLFLPEDPLKRVDDMTMAAGLEARVPFLGHELVELVARVPPALKVGAGGKPLLKAVARGLLPAELIDRPKAPFPVPPLEHLTGRTLAYVREVLAPSDARWRAILNRRWVERCLAAPRVGDASKHLWQVTVLELWLRANRI